MKVNLMSLKKYAETRHESPYIYQIEKKNKVLLILGSRHSNNSKDSQFPLFKKKLYNLKPNAVFVEGGWEKDITTRYKTQKEAIHKGEMAFLVFLAKRMKIPVLSWEPGDNKEIEFLLKKYTREQLFAHFVIRIIPYYVRDGKPKGYLEGYIKHFKKISQWKKFDYSLNNLKKIHKKIFGKELKIMNEKLYRIPPFPFKNPGAIETSILNKIAADESKFRDKFAVKTIMNNFKKYNKILAIMGSGHAVVQEPAYRELF